MHLSSGHGIGTAWLCGEKALPYHEPPDGMEVEPISDSSYLIPGKTSVPRMIVAQFDSIRHERIYRQLGPKMLKLYDSLLTSSNMEAWFTVYLVTFLLLGLVGSGSDDRLRYTRQNAGGKAQVTSPYCFSPRVAYLAFCCRKLDMDLSTVLERNLLKTSNSVGLCCSHTGSTSSARIS